MAKSGVLSQRITTTMHATTHIDAPAHVVQGTPFIDEVPLPHFFGTGIVVNLPKKKWEPITGDDLEKACGHVIRKNDVLILNTGWHHDYDYEDGDYFAYCPGFVASAGLQWCCWASLTMHRRLRSSLTGQFFQQIQKWASIRSRPWFESINIFLIARDVALVIFLAGSRKVRLHTSANN
jgi:hypothetical protein